ncbi:MAG: hypothetical protein ACRDYE_05885 [Acidimicrobiales bacterium]
MAHRIEVELTSRTGESTWTWRAAGAKQPRGTVDADLVPTGSDVGAVLRAEVETTLDGTTVLALLPGKARSGGRKTEMIEMIGSVRPGPDVNVVLAGKSRRPRDEPPGAGRRADGRRPGGERRSRHGAGERGGDNAGAAPGEEGRGRRPSGPKRDRGRTTARREGPRRLAPSSTFRNAALATLRPEQLPVAEQLLRGGIPAVRHAIDEQNGRARADGRPEVTPGPLLAMAEELLPLVNLAAWKDRASAARTAGKDVPLRELRSIVAAGSTVSLDEEGSEMAAALRTSLDQRVTALRDRWVERITSALDEGRVVDAVRASIRPPEPATRLSAELAVRLATAAGEAMSADTPAGDWLALLEVVVDSPVRRTVKPRGLPTGADEHLLAAARSASGYVPELARLMGIPIPPPPGPRRPVPARSVQGRRAS